MLFRKLSVLILCFASVACDPVSRLESGSDFSCMIRDSGTNCWGDNTYGAASPPETLINIEVMSLGGQTGCALANNSVTCWGDDGQQQATPPPLSNPSNIDVGGYFACATDDVGLQCWGQDHKGQSTALPAGLTNPTLMALGTYHGCVVDGTLIRCWGDSGYGQAPDSLDIGVPTSLSAGTFHTCAVIDNGMQCWGSDSNGQSSVPSNLENVTAIAAGSRHTCAIVGGGVECWGSDSSNQSSPPNGLTDIVEITSGDFHSCALAATGDITCWGDNASGQRDSATQFENIVDIHPSKAYAAEGLCVLQKSKTDCMNGRTYNNQRGPSRAVEDLAMGSAHYCYLSSSAGSNITCGGNSNAAGQQDFPLIHADNIESGGYHSCAINDTTNAINCWGYDNHGQTTVPNLVAPSKLVTGWDSNCVIDDGEIKCWGETSGYGWAAKSVSNPAHLDVGGDSQVCVIDDSGLVCWGQSVANQAPDMTDAIDVSVSRNHGCATNGSIVECWGEDRWGQLDVPALENPTRVFLGNDLSCALDDNGVHCWGAMRLSPTR